MLIAPLSLALLLAHPARTPCVRPAELVTAPQPLPESYGVALVGIAFDKHYRPTAVLRRGDGAKSSTNIYLAGEKAFGALRILEVGVQSLLARADGRLYVLKLRNRAVQRDWTEEARKLPRCEDVERGDAR